MNVRSYSRKGLVHQLVSHFPYMSHFPVLDNRTAAMQK